MSLAFVRGIHRGLVNSQHKGQVMRQMFLFDDIIMNYKVWGEITYPFSNMSTDDIWEWISNFFPHFTDHVISYPCGD